jgi:MFS family permease
MDFRRYASALAAFATALYVALIVAALGVISLLLDEDPVDDPHAGVLAGPVMCTAAAAIVLAVLLVRALRRPDPRRPGRERYVAPGVALLTGLGASLGYALAGGVIVALDDGSDVAPFVVQQLLGPFAVTVGALAFLVVLLDTVVIASRADEHGRPRWPWEKRDDRRER